MTDPLLSALTLAALLGCALMAGTFFAFSTFVMRALARLPPPQGIAAMQSINVAVLNPMFLAPFLGTAVLCAGLALVVLLGQPHPARGWLIAGGLLYAGGTFLVTIAFNVPRNDRLAKLDPASADAPRVWAEYVAGWTAWNHVRTAAALAATAALTLALAK
jgi:uncharacterized membrane protein